MKISPINLVNLGFKPVDRNYNDPVYQAVLKRLRSDDIDDREPSISFLKKDDTEIALIGYAMDGHGYWVAYKVKE